MNYLDYYVNWFKNAFDFDGKATRSEYWSFAIINLVISIFLSGISSTIWMIYSLILLIPSISYAIRRLHDAGKSWWWVLISIIPIIWWIWIFVLLLLSSKEDNKEKVEAKSEL